MKKTLISIMTAVGTLTVSAENPSTNSTLGGFYGASYTEGYSPKSDSLHFDNISFNLRPIWKHDLNNDWSFFSEVEFGWINQERDWLQEFGFQYKFNEDWSLQFGRLNSPMIFVTPAPRFNPTVIYPRFFRGIHNTGLKIHGKQGDLTFDLGLGGNSSVWFADSDTFSRFETDIRIRYDLTDDFFIATGSQLSHEVQRYEIDFGYNTERFHFGGALMYTTNDSLDQWSAWTLATYDLNDSWEGHLLWDYLEDNGSSILVGAGYLLSDKADLTMGYQFALDEKAPSGFSARMRWRF